MSVIASNAAPIYHVTYLGGFNFGPLHPFGLNSGNQVVGGGDGGTSGPSFLWSAGVLTALPLGGAVEINDSGQVLGYLGGPRQAAIYSGGTTTLVPLFPGSGGANPRGINSAGDVAGEFAPGGGGEVRGFSYAGGVLTDLGTTIPGGGSVAMAINDSGVIAGHSFTATGVTPAFTRGFVYSGGVMTEIGTLGGASSRAVDINNLGQIVGSAQTAAGESHGFLYFNGVMTDLGTFVPVSINDSGMMTGFTPQGPALYSGGTVSQLSALLDSAGTPFPIGSVHQINNQGAIVAVGFEQRVYDRPLLLTPVSDVPEPSAFLATAVIAAAILTSRRSRSER